MFKSKRRRQKNLNEVRELQHLVKASQNAYQAPNTRTNISTNRGNWDYVYRLSDNKRAVYKNDQNQYIVAFRGTVVTDPEDLLDDARIIKNSLSTGSRFQRERKAVEQIKQLGSVILTGHSLGGALANQIGQQTGDRSVGWNAGTAPTARNLVGNTIRRFATKGKTQAYNVSSDPISLSNPFSKRINRKAGLDPHSLNNFVVEGGKAMNKQDTRDVRKFNLFNFAKPLIEVADILQLDAKSRQAVIQLKGSQVNPTLSLYSSDYDFFQQLTQKDIPLLIPHIIQIVRLLESVDAVKVIELKLGGRHYKPSIKNLERLEPRIERLVSDDPFTKLDLVLFDGKYYQEISIVYLFEVLADAKEIQKQLLEQNREYRKQGKLYKASKRLIQSQMGTLKQRQAALKRIENPKFAMINRSANRLEAYLRFPNAKRLSLQWIKQDLSNVLNSKQQIQVAKLLDSTRAVKANAKRVLDLLEQWKLK